MSWWTVGWLAWLGAFVALYVSLRSGMSLGVGYGIWGASGVALTAIMSLIIFGEPVTLLMAIGIAVVMAVATLLRGA